MLAALKSAVPKNKSEDLEELSDLETALYRHVDREKVGQLTIDWGKLGAGLGALKIGMVIESGGRDLQ